MRSSATDSEYGSKHWWERPLSMMRVDWAPDPAAIRDLDLEEVARQHREEWGATCEWIVGTPGFEGRGHQTTFQAEGYEVCPGFEEFDYLRTYTPIAHRHGMRVLAYLNMHWFALEFADRLALVVRNPEDETLITENIPVTTDLDLVEAQVRAERQYNRPVIPIGPERID